MSRSRRGRDRGFTLMELLVTIVLAGIVFGAMVPAFLSAQGKNYTDQLRLSTLNVAQDKIEKVRSLPYDAIVVVKNPDGTPNTTTSASVNNLNSPNFASGQFGTSFSLSTGNSTRNLALSYDVTSYPIGSSGLTSEYKLVTVSVTWVGSPTPHKTATLKTIVYRQYAGPPLTHLYLNPNLDDHGVLGDINLTHVTLTAPVDLTTGVTVAKAQFQISLFGGQTIASQVVNVTDTNQALGYWYDATAKTFNWTWDCSMAVNGTYDFTVTAYSTDGFAGNTVEQIPIINHNVKPSPPSNLVAQPFNARVDLTWSASGAGDLANYVVYRSTSSTGPWTAIATVAKTALSYSDATAVNGTTYYYAVAAKASSGLLSDMIVSNAVKPIAPADTTPPTAPTITNVVKLAGIGTLEITWNAATDPGVPSTGVSKYEIYRSADNVTWPGTPLYTLTMPATGPPYVYDDASAGYGASWYYKIRAFDGLTGVGFGPGPYSASVRGGPTDAQPKHNLVISIKSGNYGPYNVWVLATSNSHYWTTANPAVDNGTGYPAAGTLIKNGSRTFYSLPDGSYTVFVNSGAYNAVTNKTYGVTLSGANGSITGVVFP